MPAIKRLAGMARSKFQLLFLGSSIRSRFIVTHPHFQIFAERLQTSNDQKLRWQGDPHRAMNEKLQKTRAIHSIEFT